MSTGPFRSYRRYGRATDDRFSDLLTIKLPLGIADIYLRLTRYADGSPAIELLDADGNAFYSPTIPVCQTTVADTVPVEYLDTMLVGIKPSAFRNGVAGALIDAGIFIDLDVEIPADHIWARMVKIAPHVFDTEPAAPPDMQPGRLKPLPVPFEWERATQRIQMAFAREGLEISAAEAMVAWAWHSRAVQRVPKPLPPAGVEIVRQLWSYFSAAKSTEGSADGFAE